MIIDKDKIEKNFNGNIFNTARDIRVSIQTIMASLKKHEINFVKPKHVYGELKRTDFSEFQKSLIVGSLLGDGHLEKRSHLKNASFREEHAMSQVEWLKWKYNNLKPFTTAKMWNRNRGNKAMFPDGKGGKKYFNIQEVCAMTTGTHPYLTYMHLEFYKDRIKIIPYTLLNKVFDEIVFLVWLCDDGYYNKNRDYVVLCTECFSYKEVKFLEKCVNKIGITNTSVIKHSKEPVSYRLYLNSFSNNEDLINKGLSILPECMYHKISSVLNEHQTATP